MVEGGLRRGYHNMKYFQIKRVALVTLLLVGGAFSAHADNDVYNNILK
jgi:hypothetical protein